MIAPETVYQPHQPHPWARRIYALVLYVVLPFVPFYLWWRGRKQPEYRRHWAERFAGYRDSKIAPQPQRIWLHAVSLGETRAAKPLIDALLAHSDDVHIILTHSTPTGRAAGTELFAAYLGGGRMTQVYAPYDLNPILNRFFRVFAPTAVWVMETEVWPNMVAQCVTRCIPISLVNGRLSDKTLHQSQHWQKLMVNAYAGFQHICAQTAADAQRYTQLDVNTAQLHCTGNLKLDMKVPQEQAQAGERLKSRLGKSRKVVLFASTREGEEQLFLDAWRAQQTAGNQTLNQHIQWWLVPRHPQRFDEVAQLLQQSVCPQGQTLLRKTALDAMTAEQQADALQQADFVLGDTMGEMFAYYALADAVLMGGTWMPYGGQNFLEPMALGKTTVVGSSVFHFETLAKEALAAQVLTQCVNLPTALQQLPNLLAHDEQKRIQAYIENARGAVERTLAVLHPVASSGETA